MPTFNYTQENEHINFKDSPFYVNTELKDWNKSPWMAQRAAISSFGFSGTNAHIVLEEAPTLYTKPQLPIKPAYLITLSAKTESSLKQKMVDLEIWLTKNQTVSLETISYTLNTGRSHFDQRCAMVISSIDELKEKLVEARRRAKYCNYLSRRCKQKAR